MESEETAGTSNNINIYVSGGNLSEPFYEFFLDAEGNNKLTNLTLDANNTYTFRRLNGQTSHPFYISDSGIGNDSSSSITLTGDGSPDGGIRGDETLTLSFNKQQSERNYLTFYCTSHSHMQSTFAIDNWEEVSVVEERLDIFAPFLEDKLTGEVYFAFDEENGDGSKFFKSFGDGTIGIKDDKNNDDFDDLIISLDLQSL